MLEKLSELENDILRLFYVYNLDAAAISIKLGMDVKFIERIKDISLEKLSTPSTTLD